MVRTTPLLRVLDSNVHWVTSSPARELLPAEALCGIWSIEDFGKLQGLSFDTVLCLDEELRAARLASALKKNRLIGIHSGPRGCVRYTESSAAWFDMGLASRLGKVRADALKMKNTRCYQELLFEMAGLKFKGEEYLIELGKGRGPRRPGETVVAIEARAGERWPNKAWAGYEDLARELQEDGCRVVSLRQRKTIADYIKDIRDCDVLVCGDTLAMHLGLALGKKVAALFTCTSPQEIHGYGRMAKIVSPLLEKYFYRTDFAREAVEAVGLSKVHGAVKALVSELPFRGLKSVRMI